MADINAQKPAETSALTTMASGALAGLIGRTILHPIDTVKARLQVQVCRMIFFLNV